MSENRMETYFNIRYEFDRERVFRRMDEVLRSGGAGYICVADGHVLSEVQRNREYRNVLNGALLTICDSGWVPVYLKWLLHADRPQYCGAQIFSDAIGMKKYRMMFLGGNRETLDALRRTLEREDPRVKHMPFEELPFCPVDEFDYAAIAGRINEYLPDIVWVSLGAPKQEIFMNRLCPHLQRGVMVAVGAVFNFASGRHIRRAPAWMVDCRLEFLYRIFNEPRKQMKRCWKIISVLPWIFIREKQRQRRPGRLPPPEGKEKRPLFPVRWFHVSAGFPATWMTCWLTGAGKKAGNSSLSATMRGSGTCPSTPAWCRWLFANSSPW